jgi:hypothetical protein
MLALKAVRASDRASTAWSSERPTFEYRPMARKPDWDQERRERRAREHGRKRLEIGPVNSHSPLSSSARYRAAIARVLRVPEELIFPQ